MTFYSVKYYNSRWINILKNGEIKILNLFFSESYQKCWWRQNLKKMKENYKFPFERLKEKQIRVVGVELKGEDCFAIFE